MAAGEYSSSGVVLAWDSIRGVGRVACEEGFDLVIHLDQLRFRAISPGKQVVCNYRFLDNRPVATCCFSARPEIPVIHPLFGSVLAPPAPLVEQLWQTPVPRFMQPTWDISTGIPPPPPRLPKILSPPVSAKPSSQPASSQSDSDSDSDCTEIGPPAARPLVPTEAQLADFFGALEKSGVVLADQINLATNETTIEADKPARFGECERLREVLAAREGELHAANTRVEFLTEEVRRLTGQAEQDLANAERVCQESVQALEKKSLEQEAALKRYKIKLGLCAEQLSTRDEELNQAKTLCKRLKSAIDVDSIDLEPSEQCQGPETESCEETSEADSKTEKRLRWRSDLENSQQTLEVWERVLTLEEEAEGLEKCRLALEAQENCSMQTTPANTSQSNNAACSSSEGNHSRGSGRRCRSRGRRSCGDNLKSNRSSNKSRKRMKRDAIHTVKLEKLEAESEIFQFMIDRQVWLVHHLAEMRREATNRKYL